jgi:hypothetical protein
MRTVKTKAGNSFQILSERAFEDNAEIVPKYGQGCNYPTGKCVEGYQVDYRVKVTLESGESKEFNIIFQSLERSDNMRAYGSSEMTTAGQYGCDGDESEELLEFTDYDNEIIEILENKAEKLCKEWFDNNKKTYNRSYRIRNTGETMIIETNEGEHIAEYRFESQAFALSEIRSMYRTIDDHIANGGTLGNYQW